MRSTSTARTPAAHLSSVPRTAAIEAYRQVLTQKWILGVLLIQFACQLGLLFESLGSLRIGFRAMSFGVSLMALASVTGRPIPHPARNIAGFILVWLGIEIFHPNSNSILSAFAQAVLYASILSPIFWVLRLRPTVELFGKFIAILFFFHITSSFFGVLQVYFPGRFQPAISSVVTSTEHGSAALEIVLASGQRVLRPMGLTDIPGGAAMSGLYAIIFGIGFYAAGKAWWQRWGGISGVFIGLFCIYLSHVRSVLIVAILVLIGFTFFLFQIGRFGHASKLALVIPMILVGSFVWATTIGGDSMVARFSSLLDESPTEVYHSNRGKFLQSTIQTELPKYPLGAGLGRWGMMNAYFGDHSPSAPAPLWAEIQWTAWTYDGGIPLICAYVLAIGYTVHYAYRIAIRNRANAFGLWAALILTYNLAACVLTFSYSLFIGQTGFEFWFLNSVLVATAVGIERREIK